MVTFEYDNTVINVPTSWDDVKLGHYETFYKIPTETHRDRVAYIAAVCQIDAGILMQWPAEVFTTLLMQLNFIFEDKPVAPCPFVDIDGVKYFVPIDDKLTLGAWIDADEVQKEGAAVLSNVLAIVCRPQGEAYDSDNNETRAAMFAALPVSKVLGVTGFFLQCITVSRLHTRAFLKVQELCDLLPQSIKSLVRLGGGIKLSQTWRIPRYLILTALLRYRLRKYSRFYCTNRTKNMQKTPSAS